MIIFPWLRFDLSYFFQRFNFLPSRSNKPSSRNSNAVPTCPNNDEVSFGWKSNSSTSLLLVLESSKLNPKFWNIQEIRLVSSEGSRYTWIPRYWHLVIIGCSSLLGCTFLGSSIPMMATRTKNGVGNWKEMAGCDSKKYDNWRHNLSLFIIFFATHDHCSVQGVSTQFSQFRNLPMLVGRWIVWGNHACQFSNSWTTGPHNFEVSPKILEYSGKN